MKILAIDTSCDDTSVAISEDLKILSNVFWSKIKLHSSWGGVVPNEARRQHDEFLEPVIKKALEESDCKLSEINYFAVTYGPGLAVALEAGIKKAKELARIYNKPVVAVNHMAAHIYACLARDKNDTPLSDLSDFEFPVIALTVSGGHTELVLITKHLDFKIIGQTIDDSAGEAIDKIGRVLGMGFPAGKPMDVAALNGNSKVFKFPRPLLNSGDFNFSFSGLKTACLYEIKKITGEYSSEQIKGKIKLSDVSLMLNSDQINDLSASFTEAVFDCLVKKSKDAITEFSPKMFIAGGGVIASTILRKKLIDISNELNVKFYYPKPFWLCTDNAAMVAITSFYMVINKSNMIFLPDRLDMIDRKPSLSLDAL